MSSEATLLHRTVIPNERNDTITITFPKNFYGYQVMVNCVRAPQPIKPLEASPKPASDACPPEILAALKAKMPKLTKEEFEALGNSPRAKALSKAFEGIEKTFPPNITRDEIREMRLKEKYGI